ncbi:DinB family protein [Sphingopyxis flava]|uniref:Uncharacterized damage-inducible protein DinB (Forms a four-helix bundle) n=1 Tax=Sphingopyxis flava TaxID=1507287 RepID=A0A1T5DMZ6_9SPHN|nr:DinB family protein [Sphingopyxis flava]SKB73088.1 Uncharacterized damage-inducible protein DinB (forms a four-helix bundle) [Sphingopyxis flava]
MVNLPFMQLVDVKRWADRELLEAIEQSRDALSEQDMDILHRLLDHIHAVDRIFQHHLEGKAHTYRAPQTETLPGLCALKSSISEGDDWYAAYVEALPFEAFDEAVDFTFTSGRPARMSRGQIILHVCLHGTYHRGNAGALLQLRGLSPGRDSVADYLQAAA